MELDWKHCLDYCISVTGFKNYDEKTINLFYFVIVNGEHLPLWRFAPNRT